MKFLADFFPIILFFAAFKWGGSDPEQTAALMNTVMYNVTPEQAPVLAATFVAIAATVVQVAFKLVRGHKPEPALWISLAVIVIFGGLTLWLHNEWFIKWKPSILYWIFAGILVFGELSGRNFMKKLMGSQIQLHDTAWAKLQRAWIAFLAGTGALNLFVAYTFSTETWVNFKLFGLMSLTFIFTIGVILWVMKISEALQK